MDLETLKAVAEIVGQTTGAAKVVMITWFSVGMARFIIGCGLADL